MSWKRQEKTILPFDVVPNLVGLSTARLDPAWNEPSDTPLTHWAPKTYWMKHIYIPQNIPIYPQFIYKAASGTNRHQHSTDTDRQQEILFSMYDWVNLELNHNFGKTLKGKICFTWHFWDIKLSKPPNVPFPKIVGFCNFLRIWHLSQRNYNWQSFWITL